MVADASDVLRKNGTVRLNGKVNGIHRHTNGHRQNGHTKKVVGVFFLSLSLCILSGERYVMTDRPILPSFMSLPLAVTMRSVYIIYSLFLSIHISCRNAVCNMTSYFSLNLHERDSN